MSGVLVVPLMPFMFLVVTMHSIRRGWDTRMIHACVRVRTCRINHCHAPYGAALELDGANMYAIPMRRPKGSLTFESPNVGSRRKEERREIA